MGVVTLTRAASTRPALPPQPPSIPSVKWGAGVDQAAVGNRYARSGRRRSWNQRATPLTQCCLHVAASSLSAGAPHTRRRRDYTPSQDPQRGRRHLLARVSRQSRRCTCTRTCVTKAPTRARSSARPHGRDGRLLLRHRVSFGPPRDSGPWVR